MKSLLAVLLIAAFLLSGCQAAPAGPAITPGALPTPTHVPAPTAESTPTPAGPITLRVWLPPQFDPEADTPGGMILRRRLDEYHARRPDVRIQVRIKAADGPGGLLDSLTSASAAAPLALPDLVALPRPQLETAALKGLLHPFDDLVNDRDDPDWFPYARQLASLQDSLFGIPFAGDALVLVYRTQDGLQPPDRLADTPLPAGPLAFPAADPQALFSLALYQGAGGPILDNEGRPTLDAPTLARVLAFYQQAAASDLAPIWLTQLQTDEQAWDAFLDSQASMAVTWFSNFLASAPDGVQAASLPSLDGNAFTLAGGWVWALSSPNPEHQRISAELAQFLTESSFMAEWTAQAGYLPPRPSALDRWEAGGLHTLSGKTSASAWLIPSTDVLASLAPLLQQATMQVLKQQADADTAAREASEMLTAP